MTVAIKNIITEYYNCILEYLYEYLCKYKKKTNNFVTLSRKFYIYLFYNVHYSIKIHTNKFWKETLNIQVIFQKNYSFVSCNTLLILSIMILILIYPLFLNIKPNLFLINYPLIDHLVFFM